MNRNTRSYFMLSVVLIIVLSAFSFIAGIGVAPFLGKVNLHRNTAENPIEFQKLTEIWGILKQDFIDKETLNMKSQIEGAIKGMLSTLNDPFTTYLDSEHYKLEMDFLSGKFEGIGAHVGLEDSKIVIIAPMPGSPAEKSGIRPGDIILKINDQLIDGLNLNEVVSRIRGPKDTVVKLEVLHKGDTVPVEMEIIRAEIELKTVSSEMMGDIAVVKISYFSENTNENLKTEIQKALDHEARAMIIDLRFNPGGLLNAVVAVAGNFMKKGDTLLHTVDSQKNKVTTAVQEDGILKDMPLAVLINEFSASGSEVMAGAMQDNQRGVLIGTDSFGKSAVNIIRPLSDGSALVVTTARWLTPNGRQIGKDKIQPDIEVKPSGDPKKDGQLQAALDYLKTIIPVSSKS